MSKQLPDFKLTPPVPKRMRGIRTDKFVYNGRVYKKEVITRVTLKVLEKFLTMEVVKKFNIRGFLGVTAHRCFPNGNQLEGGAARYMLNARFTMTTYSVFVFSSMSEMTNAIKHGKKLVLRLNNHCLNDSSIEVE